LSVGGRRPTIKDGALIIKEQEKKPNSPLLIASSLIAAVRLNREEIKASPSVTAKISESIRLAEMIQGRLTTNAMPIRSYSSLLREELCARNASYAALHKLSHVTSYGEVPVVVYQPSPCGTQHGNFIPASYRALQRRPQWKRRFEKVHSQAGRAFPKSDGVSKELDSSMSSDALLMNIFCYPGVTKRRELSLILGT
jgi:hypothetical protein